MEEAPENGKESPHSAHANGMNEYEIKHLFSVLFCVVRAVHKFDVRPAINDTPNKWASVEIR